MTVGGAIIEETALSMTSLQRTTDTAARRQTLHERMETQLSAEKIAYTNIYQSEDICD